MLSRNRTNKAAHPSVRCPGFSSNLRLAVTMQHTLWVASCPSRGSFILLCAKCGSWMENGSSGLNEPCPSKTAAGPSFPSRGRRDQHSRFFKKLLHPKCALGPQCTIDQPIKVGDDDWQQLFPSAEVQESAPVAVESGNSAGVGDGQHPDASSLEPTPAEQTGNFLMPEQSLDTGASRPRVDRRRFRL